MANKPPPPSAEMRAFLFGKGCDLQSERKPEAVPTITGAAPMSLNLLMSDPAFGGCRWPTTQEGEPVQFCCAPAIGKFCATHRRFGIIAIAAHGRGSAAEFIRGLERFI